MHQRKSHTEIILDSIADGVFTVDSQWRITSFNKAAEKITGIVAKEALGRHCWDVFRANICESNCSLRQTMETGEQIVNRPVFIVNSKGERVPLSISTAILRDERGRVIGGVETFRDLTMVEELRKELEARRSFFDIISKNPEMHRLFWMLEQVAERDTTVLLLGESGTGKELFAKAIHSLSPRKEAPFVTINCGAIPDTLLESELFGYKAGAFTDAKRDKPGKVAVAKGGTLFLDEIGDISPTLQVKLLRLLQEKTYEPLGQTKSLEADVRIVAATNRNLELLVRQGKFRADLYYRINVVKLVLPPLRERKEDIPLLAQHFVRKFNSLTGKDIRGLSPEALATLMTHEFPGNVRELENIIEYASITCKDQFIGVEHLPDYLQYVRDVGSSGLEGRGVSSLESLERAFLIEALRRHKFSRKATAAYLGIHPTTLWRKMKRLGIRVPKAS
ncbi:MAG: Fis family transcriptional regulator [Deltaproteobacteria bacterium]|nr:MAG: Fis family transcriptional regulator [Deltaproteobacteria bacterium]